MRHIRAAAAAAAVALSLVLYACGGGGGGGTTSPNPSPAPEAAYRITPYLVYGGDNTAMTVLWQTASAPAATISWGTDGTYSAGTAQVAESGPDHRFSWTITGLTPGTRYEYRVSTPSGDATGSFFSAPPADSTRGSLFIIGDTRTNADVHDGLAAAMVAAYTADPRLRSLALLPGDLTTDGDSASTWMSEFFNPRHASIRRFQADIPRVAAMGNHEGNGSLFRKFFPYPFVGGRYWSLDYGPFHVAVLDQYQSGGMSEEQRNWLTADLAATDRPWKLIMVHRPGWSAGGHAPDGDVRQFVQPLAKQYGALVIAGHNHYYARDVVDGVQHVTSGGGGAPLVAPDPNLPAVAAAARKHHYCTLTADGNLLTLTALAADGTVLDTVNVTR